MKKIFCYSLVILLFLSGIFFWHFTYGIERKRGSFTLGDVKEGWKIFNIKKCSICHSIWGEGGKGGPDLGTLPKSYKTPSQLVALIWNHGPQMWAKMPVKKIIYTKIDKKEMADLFAFLYFLRYMDEPGNPLNGKKVLETKGCKICHSLEKGLKGELDQWGRYVNPILWAQTMWNHASQMEKEMKRKEISWIQFKGNEMVDLISYIRSLTPEVERFYLSPGNPLYGEIIFKRKGCSECHRPETKLDLLKIRELPNTIGQLAGVMWNHLPEMWKEMEEKGKKRPLLTAQEMADLTAYLFSIQYFDFPGDAIRGESVFINKRCNLCHMKGGRGPDLTKLKDRISPISMAQAIWNHGPEMWEEMSKANISWKKIDHRELVDLMEFLNRGIP
ncbi:MAG: c-type cytochrome [Thermodesulfobacteriota bacterium]